MNPSLQSLHVRVARKETVALGVAVFEFVSVEGMSLPAFEAGSHIDVAVPGGITRQYSLCNDPRESHRYQIAVLNVADGRGGSRAMHERVSVGDVVAISHPRNHFPLASADGHSLLFAGGIGITPLLCMAERLSQAGRSFALHYFARSAAHAAFRDRIAGARFADKVFFHFDGHASAGRSGLQELLTPRGADAHLYTCGPRGFMDAVLEGARRRGWTDAQLHQEHFGAGPVPHGGDRTFEVQLASTGRIIRVGADQTVIAALAAQGVTIETSCEQGVCGTCLTPVLSGEPDHRDAYLTTAERALNDQFLPCCSRSKSDRLVLGV